jgi:hypothetical protein
MRWLLCTLLCLAAPSTAAAQVALPLARIAPADVRVDGALREWRDIRRLEVGGGSDAALSVSFAYADAGLYVAAEVTDERFVRTSAHGGDEDVIIVTLAFPRGRGLRGVELWLYAGESGRSAAVVTSGAIGARRRSEVRGAEIVEAPRSAGGAGGYSLEAFVPWSAVPGSERLEEGRGAVRLRDVDEAAHPTIEQEPSLGPVAPRDLSALLPLRPAGGEVATMEAFLAAQGLAGSLPSHDFREDVAGDERAERIALVERFVVVMGGGYGGGAGYGFLGLDVESPGDLRDVALRDLTGDGREELTFVARQRGTGGSRDLLEVLSFAGDSPAVVFAVELREETAAGVVENRVRFERGRRGRPTAIVVSAVAAPGLDAAGWRMEPASDVEPLLLPWGPVRERTYQWDGARFSRDGERPNPEHAEPAAPVASSGAGEGAGAATSPSPPPGTDELLAAWRREAGLPRSARARFDLAANLAGDPTPERLLVHGTRMVVVGPAFRDGTGWFDFGVPAASEADLLGVTVADVTGEGRAEIFFRIRQTIGEVRREVLVVCHFVPDGFETLLTREVAREQAGQRIENEILTSGGRLEIRPGSARGWSAATWPFADSAGADGVEPPLLPWRDRPLRFRHAGGRLVPAP